MYVEDIQARKNGRRYRTVLIRESYRHEGKVKHRTLSNITNLPEENIGQIKAMLSGEGTMINKSELESRNGREYGASFAFLRLARQIGLDKLIYSRKEQWREDALAMIVGRIVYQGSKLALTNLFRDTALWELCGHEPEQKPDPEKHCYEVLDRLRKRQAAIQKRLAQQRLTDGCLVLYDITNTWLEGEYQDSELADFGRSKSGKRGYKQIAIGLLTDAQGCPVAVEVFRGNTADETTVWEQAQNLAHRYGVEEVVFAGDRGMLTPRRIEEVNSFGFKTLTALTHTQVNKLITRNVIQPGLFDEKNIAEVVDPEQPQIRYMLCKNPETMHRERATRRSMLETVSGKLKRIAAVKRKRDPNSVSARVGKIFSTYPVQKFFDWHVSDRGELTFTLNEQLVKAEESLDGCYVVRTDVAADKLSTDQAVDSYKRLSRVEQAFRSLKTVALEIRPVHHKTDERIRAHVFVCFLAYYLLWHAEQRLVPLFQSDGQGRHQRWSMELVVQRLANLQKETCLIGGNPIGIIRSQPDEEQQKILDFLGVTWHVATN